MKFETWNPLTGCDRTSPGCDHCYALNRAARLKLDGSRRYQLDGDPRTSGPGFALQMWSDKLDVPHHWREPRSVFVNSMSDVFHRLVSDDFIHRIFTVIADTPQHHYEILTKRSQRLARLAPRLPWPDNLWMGVTVENQRYSFRVDHLRQVPAVIRFLSVEPMLGPIKLDLEGIDWVRCGGETEPGYRELDPNWVRQLRDQCVAARVPFSFMHWSGLHRQDHGRLLDGQVWDQVPQAPESLGPLLTQGRRH